jgi:PhzF family phenazine biosynthesis protein
MSQAIVVVDAFTDRPFAGNPAAVCVLSGPADERWMQCVAAEMNLSETAFLNREGKGYRLRWFTPKVEVDLCGHATLASAHALWTDGHLAPTERAWFETRSGSLWAERKDDWIEMDFPAKPPEMAAEPPSGLAESLGVPIVDAGRNAFDWLVEVDSETTVRNLAPDLRRLAELPVRGVIVTSRADAVAAPAHAAYDFISRFFAPRAGVDEDPVTGSAHCALGPYWGERLGKSELVGFQASRRGGVVRMRMEGPRVVLSGQAVTVWRGALVRPVPPCATSGLPTSKEM